MSNFKVALLQMLASGSDQAANLAKGEAFCRQACDLGADVALFPEMWNIGYTFYDGVQHKNLAAWQAQAIGHDDGFVQHFQVA